MQKIKQAKWVFETVDMGEDNGRHRGYGIGCDLVAPDGEVLAGCLWHKGEIDTESDGCGVFLDVSFEEIPWPDESDAKAAIGED